MITAAVCVGNASELDECLANLQRCTRLLSASLAYTGSVSALGLALSRQNVCLIYLTSALPCLLSTCYPMSSVLC